MLQSSSDPEASWIDDADLPPLTAARLLALKVLVNRCLPFAGTESSTTVATPVFGFLWKLVGIGREGGEEEERLSPVVASRLRLKASTSVLKLLGTKDPALLKLAIKNFALLSRTAQVRASPEGTFLLTANADRRCAMSVGYLFRSSRWLSSQVASLSPTQSPTSRHASFLPHVPLPYRSRA